MDEHPEWFAPKRYGFGAGLPIAWQGWAVLSALGILIGLAFRIFDPANPLILTIVIPAVVAFLLIAARTTRGGWRWRWGDRD